MREARSLSTAPKQARSAVTNTPRPLVLQASTALGPQPRLGRGAPRRRRRSQQPTGLRRTGGGESFLRVHGVAVPKALRARRANRHGGPAGSLLIFSAWKFVLTAAMMAAPIPIGVLVRGGRPCACCLRHPDSAPPSRSLCGCE
eukprot:COSAG01_NODE_1757_length_9317_cov_3.510089_10_plen_144_part_00